jgi:hypothetical protein
VVKLAVIDQHQYVSGAFNYHKNPSKAEHGPVKRSLRLFLQQPTQRGSDWVRSLEIGLDAVLPEEQLINDQTCCKRSWF